jgi:uncharacterized protein DUF6232
MGTIQNFIWSKKFILLPKTKQKSSSSLKLNLRRSEKTVEAKNELVLYDHNGVRITNLQAVFGAQTYTFAESNITWIKDERVDPSGGLAQVMLVIGFLLMAFAFVERDVMRWILFGVGLVLAAAGAYWQRSQKKEYLLTFGSAYREISSYSSTSEEEIKNIAAAMRQVIIQERE